MIYSVDHHDPTYLECRSSRICDVATWYVHQHLLSQISKPQWKYWKGTLIQKALEQLSCPTKMETYH